MSELAQFLYPFTLSEAEEHYRCFPMYAPALVAQRKEAYLKCVSSALDRTRAVNLEVALTSARYAIDAYYGVKPKTFKEGLKTFLYGRRAR